MAKVLVLSGTNHNFATCAPIICAALQREGHTSTLTDDKDQLAAASLANFDVVLLGSGFTRRVPQPDGTSRFEAELTDAQSDGLLRFVRGGKGFVGVHGTGWRISGEHIQLVGGHANWHPPGLEFTVRVDVPAHAIMQGIEDFTVQDEIYMSAWDINVQVLATAVWADVRHPMAWTHAYGQGRVFYTTLGHAANTFENNAVQRMLANGVAWAAAR